MVGDQTTNCQLVVKLPIGSAPQKIQLAVENREGKMIWWAHANLNLQGRKTMASNKNNLRN